MKTNIPKHVTDTAVGRQMADILQTCVHCGMCNATCPTYQLNGNELDGPRGRIYLIKSMLEGEQVGVKTQRHLDRCLTCRSCETTCPSGVKYGHLVELARPQLERKVGRKLLDRLRRWIIKQLVPYPARFGCAVRLGRFVKPILPSRLAELTPMQATERQRAQRIKHKRKMLLLRGCAQSVVAPNINHAAIALFDRLGISLCEIDEAGCCGAVDYHLNDLDKAIMRARSNIDAWWPEIENGAESLLVASSGCAAMLKDYPQLFREDAQYLAKAQTISELVADPAEKIDLAKLKTLIPHKNQKLIAFQIPCTMHHTTHSDHAVRRCLQSVGFEFTNPSEQHLCCGSAGSYSLLQPELSERLLDNKLRALDAGDPHMIVTANIGCHMHLSRRARVPVLHWLEAIAANS